VGGNTNTFDVAAVDVELTSLIVTFANSMELFWFACCEREKLHAGLSHVPINREPLPLPASSPTADIIRSKT